MSTQYRIARRRGWFFTTALPLPHSHNWVIDGCRRSHARLRSQTARGHARMSEVVKSYDRQNLYTQINTKPAS